MCSIDVGKVGGDDAAAAEADGLEGHGVRGLALQHAGRPLEEAVPVLDQVPERAEEGIDLEAMSTRLLPGVAPAPVAEHLEKESELHGDLIFGACGRSHCEWKLEPEAPSGICSE